MMFRNFQVSAVFRIPMSPGKYPLVMSKIAIETGPVEIVDLPTEHGGSFHSYVSLPEGKSH